MGCCTEWKERCEKKVQTCLAIVPNINQINSCHTVREYLGVSRIRVFSAI